MRFDPAASRESVLDTLRGDAERAYGAERLDELSPFLDLTATALWRLGQVELELTDDEPDALAARGPRG